MSIFSKLIPKAEATGAPTAEAIRVEFARHEERIAEARAINAWVAEFEVEAQAIEDERQKALQAHAQSPTKASAGRFIDADAKMPRAASLRLAVRAEAGRSENPVRAVRIQSLGKLLTMIEAHAFRVGDTEAAAYASKRSGELTIHQEEIDLWAARYVAVATDSPKDKPNTKPSVVNVGFMGQHPTMRRPRVAEFFGL
jgi:hypothetical protein